VRKRRRHGFSFAGVQTDCTGDAKTTCLSRRTPCLPCRRCLVYVSSVFVLPTRLTESVEVFNSSHGFAVDSHNTHVTTHLATMSVQRKITDTQAHRRMSSRSSKTKVTHPTPSISISHIPTKPISISTHSRLKARGEMKATRLLDYICRRILNILPFFSHGLDVS
jgi:hypothetical protein